MAKVKTYKTRQRQKIVFAVAAVVVALACAGALYLTGVIGGGDRVEETVEPTSSVSSSAAPQDELASLPSLEGDEVKEMEIGASSSAAAETEPEDGKAVLDGSSQPLTDERLSRMRAAYGEDQRSAVDLLAEAMWVSLDESTIVEFGDAQVSLSSGGDAQVSDYAISAMYEMTGQNVGSGSTFMAIETPTGTSIGVYTESTDPETGVTTASLICPAYGNGIFYRAAREGEVVADALPEEVNALFGEDVDVSAEVAAFVEKNYPTAHKATWSKQVTGDWAEGYVLTSYTIDNRSTSTISVRFDIEEAKAKIYATSGA